MKRASFVRRYLATPGLAALRYELWKRDARSDSASTKRFSIEHSIELLDIFNSPLLDSRVSKTLFILGNGWSINDMSDEMFAHIKAHQSVGVNFWFFHDFIPNAFSFDAGIPEPEKSKEQDPLVQMGKLFSRTALVDSQPKVLYLRPYQSDPRHLIPLPSSLRGGAWVGGRANFLSSIRRGLAADIRFILKRISNRRWIPHILPDNGASIVRLIFLGLARGFRDIVLVGVDLDTRPHFWFAQDYADRYPDFVALFPPPDGTLHGTAEAIRRPIGNREFIEICQGVMTEMGMGQLWAASTDSALSSILPQYCWPN